MDIEDLELMTSDDDFAMEENDSTHEDESSGRKQQINGTQKSGERCQKMDVDSNDELLSEKGQKNEEDERKMQRRRERFGSVEQKDYEGDEYDNNCRLDKKQTRQSHGSKRRKGRSSELPSYNKARLLKPLYETKNLEPDILGRELAYRLEEKKSIVIKNVVRVLGSRGSMDLFEETVKIQKGKGIPTADGKRRRSSGGVYLYLLKQRATKEEWNLIFKEDKEITKQKEKRKKQMEKEQRITAMKALRRGDIVVNTEKEDVESNGEKTVKCLDQEHVQKEGEES